MRTGMLLHTQSFASLLCHISRPLDFVLHCKSLKELQYKRLWYVAQRAGKALNEQNHVPVHAQSPETENVIAVELTVVTIFESSSADVLTRTSTAFFVRTGDGYIYLLFLTIAWFPQLWHVVPKRLFLSLHFTLLSLTQLYLQWRPAFSSGAHFVTWSNTHSVICWCSLGRN